MEEKLIQTKIKVLKIEELSSSEKKLIKEANKQSLMAYAPYSNFQVGSALLLENGEIIGGNNQENSSFSAGICAERVALFSAKSQYPSVNILTLAIVAKKNEHTTESPVCPCGICLQALLEYEEKQNKPIKLILAGKKEVYIIEKIKDCLPLSFKM